MATESADLHTEDLTWARALAGGDRDALDRYESELVPLIDAQLKRRGFTADQIAEVQQTLRARFFVGDAEGPAITGYAGRGRLRSWVLVAALREAVRQRQRFAPELSTDDDGMFDLAERAEVFAQEGTHKDLYRNVFRDAFRKVLGELVARDRNLLRLHVIDELTIDEIGTLHGVHRATAARWLDRVREHVALGVRREVARELGTDMFEASELMQWVKSRIELSLSGLASR
ncbi:MAG TPA: sigma factor-like helix-turn-helix DNA-binding protein [Kofleriaceae bacterium]|nr:sigma factor-like helix-turn-helix DNA-binding protein [Kofleriaceae bacterium]